MTLKADSRRLANLHSWTTKSWTTKNDGQPWTRQKLDSHGLANHGLHSWTTDLNPFNALHGAVTSWDKVWDAVRTPAAGTPNFDRGHERAAAVVIVRALQCEQPLERARLWHQIQIV